MRRRASDRVSLVGPPRLTWASGKQPGPTREFSCVDDRGAWLAPCALWRPRLALFTELALHGLAVRLGVLRKPQPLVR